MKTLLKKNFNVATPLLMVLFFSIIYIPYIFKGGFIVDDWGAIHSKETYNSFGNIFSSYFPLFSNRPLAPFILSICSILFGYSPAGYIIVNLFFWFSAIIICALIFKEYTNELFSIIFVLMASMPVIASTIIFSPVTQMLNPLSIFLWSLSLYILNKYLRIHRPWLLVPAYLLLFIASLIYEVIFPLLVLTILLPWFVEYFKNDKKILIRQYFTKYILPVISILILATLYQKVIMPHFMMVYSRLNIGLPSSLIKLGFVLGVRWLIAIFADFPNLLLDSIFYFGLSLLKRIDILVAIAAIIVIFIFSRDIKKIETRRQSEKLFLFVMFLIAFFAGAVLYMLSGNPATISGYNNRGLSSAWLSLSFLIAFLGYKFSVTKFYWVIPIFFILLSLTFIAERDNYIQSYNLQLAIVNDVILKIKEINAFPGAIVFGNVPLYLEKNFNNEEVFSQPWDFGSALNIKSGRFIEGGNVLQLLTINRPNHVEFKDESLILDGWWEINGKDIVARSYYYEYNQNTKESKLLKIESTDSLKKIIDNISVECINDVPPRRFLFEILFKPLVNRILPNLGINKIWY